MRKLPTRSWAPSDPPPPPEWWDHLYANRLVWQTAMLNCPAKRVYVGSMGCLYGQQSCLAHLLGYYNGNGVYNAWSNGSVPKGQRLKLLGLFAGPNGHIWVKLKMMEMKMDLTQYKIWVPFGINVPAD